MENFIDITIKYLKKIIKNKAKMPNTFLIECFNLNDLFIKRLTLDLIKQSENRTLRKHLYSIISKQTNIIKIDIIESINYVADILSKNEIKTVLELFNAEPDSLVRHYYILLLIDAFSVQKWGRNTLLKFYHNSIGIEKFTFAYGLYKYDKDLKYIDFLYDELIKNYDVERMLHILTLFRYMKEEKILPNRYRNKVIAHVKQTPNYEDKSFFDIKDTIYYLESNKKKSC